jgi:hypothetical protein
MKDLFADLALGDDDFLSLDQLERELQEMEENHANSSTSTSAFGNFDTAAAVAPLTAAGLIVQQQQQQQSMISSMSLFGSGGGPPAGSATFGTGGMVAPALNSSLFAPGGGGEGAFFQLPSPSFPAVTTADQHINPTTTLDAWSLSLQSFSGTSLLHEDFLQADQARKHQHQQQVTPPPVALAGGPPPPGLQNLPEYDISAVPPPGLRAERAVPPPDLIEQAAHRLATGAPAATTTTTIQDAQEVPAVPTMMMTMMTPPRHLTFPLTTAGIPMTPPPEGRAPPAGSPWHRTPPPPTPFSTPQHSIGTVGPSPPPPLVTPLPLAMIQQQQQQQQQPPPTVPAVPPSVRPRIYANPHPTAEPVNAANIPSRFMTPRDLCYVVHSILKPILTQNADAASTYHLEYWLRHHPAAPLVPANQQLGSGNNNRAELVMASRSAKATEWSKENKVLGSTAKSVVTRPRALIAVHILQPGEDEDVNESETTKHHHQQRAALWKARVRIDQGYACYTQLQHSAAARIKLLKCWGVQNGRLDDITIFQGVLKLAKGRTLLARTLEQYPEVIPMFLLPATLTTLAGGSGGTTATTTVTVVPVVLPITDNRLCAAWARVIASASTDLIIAQEVLFLSCVQIVIDHGHVILHDTSHMMIAHALLQRAGAAATTNADFAAAYGPLEAKFMELLSTV